MSRKSVSKAAKAYPPIASREEAEEAIREVGALLRQKDQAEARLADKIAALKADAIAVCRPLAETLKAKVDALHAWAESHKSELLEDGKRSVKLAQGTIGWRWNPPSVKLAGDESAIIEALRRLNLGDLVREKAEIDKDAILADPKRVEGIAGIAVSQAEQFWVKPAEIEVEQVKTSRTVKGKDVAPAAPAEREAA